MKKEINVALSGSASGVATLLGNQLMLDGRYGKVILMDIEPPSGDRGEFEFVEVDLSNPTSDEKIHEILDRYDIDIFVHCAFKDVPGRTAQLDHEIETVGTMNILSACSRKKVKKFILLSSTQLYGAHPDNPHLLKESNMLRADAGYQFFHDKIEAHRMVEEFANRNIQTIVSILRICPIAGFRTDSIITRIISNLWVPVIAGYNPLIQLIHIQDAVRAFKIFCDGDYPGIFNITGSGYIPLKTAIHLIGNIPVSVPEPLFDLLIRGMYSFYLTPVSPEIKPYLKYSVIADGKKAKEVAGFSPTYSIREAIEELYRSLARRRIEKI